MAKAQASACRDKSSDVMFHKRIPSLKLFFKKGSRIPAPRICHLRSIPFPSYVKAIWRWGDINMRKVNHHLALCRVDDRDVAGDVARVLPVTSDTPDNYVNTRHRRREVVRQPALISKLKTWCCIALLSCCCVAMTAPWDKAVACFGPASERRPFFDELPPHFDEPVAAQITVTALLESQIPARLVGQASFNVLARVDRMLKGSLDGQTIKIIAPASSCDYPFIVGSSGIVMGKPILTEGGMTELHITAQWIAERWERQRRREQGNPR